MARVRSAAETPGEQAEGRPQEIAELRAEAAVEREVIDDLERAEPLPADLVEAGSSCTCAASTARPHRPRRRARQSHRRSRRRHPRDDGSRRPRTAATDRGSEPSAKSDAAVKWPRASQVPLQLDLRGLTVSEALREVETYLDQLLRADIRQRRILHGKGTGALREAVRAYLSSCTFVSSFKYAPPNQGGDGVTEIELAGSRPTN